MRVGEGEGMKKRKGGRREREGERGKERRGGRERAGKGGNKPRIPQCTCMFDFLSGGRRTSTTIKVVSLMRSRMYDGDGSPRSSASPEPPSEGQGEGSREREMERKEPSPEGMWCTASLVYDYTQCESIVH